LAWLMTAISSKLRDTSDFDQGRTITDFVHEVGHTNFRNASSIQTCSTLCA
jgi:hypothetical protein